MPWNLTQELKSVLFTVIFKIIVKSNIRSLTLIKSKITENNNNDFHFNFKFILYAILQELCC